MLTFIKKKFLRSYKLSLTGFTLIELTISLAIMGMMMGVLLSSYPETAIRLTLVNVSHTTSLLLREAQVRGSAIDSGNTALTEESPYGGYGVYVETNNQNNIILFNDFVDPNSPKPLGLAVGDGLYQKVAPLNETNRTVLFPSGYFVSKICVSNDLPFVFKCNNLSSPTINNLTVSFTRPNPQPDIYINNSSAVNFSAACIEVRSQRAPATGHVRAIQVFNSGMIRTQTGHCDDSVL
ncbi:MAG: type II secretion system protein [Candidatus Taylorbacteria bacterium]|nr:type II secretion system protein [Candidatus Taylorbacteria bacterium]